MKEIQLSADNIGGEFKKNGPAFRSVCFLQFVECATRARFYDFEL